MISCDWGASHCVNAASVPPLAMVLTGLSIVAERIFPSTRLMVSSSVNVSWPTEARYLPGSLSTSTQLLGVSATGVCIHTAGSVTCDFSGGTWRTISAAVLSDGLTLFKVRSKSIEDWPRMTCEPLAQDEGLPTLT